MVADGGIPASPTPVIPSTDKRRSDQLLVPPTMSFGLSDKKDRKLTALPSHLVPKVRWEPLPASTTGTAPAGRSSHSMARHTDRHLGDSFHIIGGFTAPSCGRREREVAAFRTPDDASLATPGGYSRLEWQPVRGELPQRLVSPVACTIGSSIVVFGGYDVDAGCATNAVHVYDSERGEWLTLPCQGGSPPQTFEHAAVACDGDRQMLVHGGRGGEASPAFDNLFTLELGTQNIHYRPLKPAATSVLGDRDGLRTLFKAPVRRAHTLCKGSESGRAYLFGGFGSDNRVSDELHVLDLEHCIWIAVEPDGAKGQFPRARAYHTSTVLGCYMAVFGGEDEDGLPLDDLHLLHLPTLLWTCPQVQPGPTEGLDPRSNGEGGGEAATASPAQDAQNDVAPNVEKGKSTAAIEKGDVDGAAEGEEEEEEMSARAHGPGVRSRHAAISLPKGSISGAYSFIVFGGVGSSGNFLDDAHSLVLELAPDPPGPIGFPRVSVTAASSDAALDFCTSELQNNLRRAQAEHAQRMDAGREELKHLAQEVLNLQTCTMAVQAQEYKNGNLARDAQERERAGQQELLCRKQQQLEDQNEAKAKLREFQIELERLNAKVARLQGAAMADEAQLLPVTDIELIEDETAQHVQDDKAPTGEVIRGEAYWRGTTVACDVIKLFKETSVCSTLITSSRKKGERDREKLEEQQRRAQEHENWEQATWRELRILSRLRHPNLQEVYGASMSEDSVLLVCEPNLIRLSQHMSTLEMPLGENEKLYVALDVANALEYLHAKGVAHRHLAEENVLVKDPQAISVKLAGHFAARVTCRAANKAADKSLKAIESESENGYALLSRDNCQTRPEQGYSGSRRSSKGDAGAAANVPDPRTTDVMAFGSFLGWLWAGADMDESLKLVMRKCGLSDPAIRPSARVIQKALQTVQHGDIDELPEVTGDPSVESALADLAVVSDEDC